MRLPHRHVELRSPPVVEVAKLAVLVGAPAVVRVDGCLLILDAKLLQRHARSAQVLVHPGEVDRCSAGRLVTANLFEEPRLEFGIAQRLGRRPGHPRAFGPAQILADRSLRQARRRLDLPLRAALLVLQSQYFSDLSHGVSRRHPFVPRPEVRESGVGCDHRVVAAPEARAGWPCASRDWTSAPAGAQVRRNSCPGHRNQCPGAPESVPRSSGISAQVLPESVPRCQRNGCPSRAGIRR